MTESCLAHANPKYEECLPHRESQQQLPLNSSFQEFGRKRLASRQRWLVGTCTSARRPRSLREQHWKKSTSISKALSKPSGSRLSPPAFLDTDAWWWRVHDPILKITTTSPRSGDDFTVTAKMSVSVAIFCFIGRLRAQLNSTQHGAGQPSRPLSPAVGSGAAYPTFVQAPQRSDGNRSPE
jgi:hypothetical protein